MKQLLPIVEIMVAEIDYSKAMMTNRNELKNSFTTFSFIVKFLQSGPELLFNH